MSEKPVEVIFDLNQVGPAVLVKDLELHRVYWLHQEGSPRYASLRYMGKTLSLDPAQMAAIATHHFQGSRAKLDVFLRARPDGLLQDREGHRIELFAYLGEE